MFNILFELEYLNYLFYVTTIMICTNILKSIRKSLIYLAQALTTTYTLFPISQYGLTRKKKFTVKYTRIKTENTGRTRSVAPNKRSREKKSSHPSFSSSK